MLCRDAGRRSVARVGDLSRKQLIAYLVVGAVVVVLGALWVRGGAGGPTGAAGADGGRAVGGARGDGRAGGSAGDGAGADGGAGGQAAEASDDGEDGVVLDRAAAGAIVVHVAGAVRHPGVYRLAAGARVSTALRRAGGARPNANLDAVNLAAKLTDGRQVLVPARITAGAGSAGGGEGSGGAAGSGAGAAPINLNAATVEQLAELDGVGPVMAQKIVDYREQHGGFGSVDELDQVPGIGPKRLESLRDRVTA